MVKTTTDKRNTEKCWHALYVASRQEKKAGIALHEKGIETYVPLIKTIRQWSDRKKKVELPLLKGYIFVHTAPNENEKVLMTRGVVNFVRIERSIATVRDEEIERLRQLISLGYHLEMKNDKSEFAKGDRIRIIEGPLKNITGFITGNKNARMLDVVLECIGIVIRVKIPEEILIPAGHEPK